MKSVPWRIIPALMILSSVIMLVVPHSFAVAQTAGALFPLGLLLWSFISAREDSGRRSALEAERRKILEAARDGHRVRIDDSGELRPAGVLSVSELRRRREKAWQEAKQLTALEGSVQKRMREFDRKIAEIAQLDERIGVLEQQERARRYGYKIPPAEQVQALAEKYGVPVVTPLQKNAKTLPVLHTGPAVRAVMSEKELADLRRRLEESRGRPHAVLSGASVSMAEFAENIKAFQKAMAGPEKEYVPEGQKELSEALLLDLVGQYDGAAPGSHWEMNAEWRAEVGKLAWSNGSPVYRPRMRTSQWQSDGLLLGFPVRISDDYGAPTLVS